MRDVHPPLPDWLRRVLVTGGAAARGPDLSARIARAVAAGGATAVVLREKDLERDALVRLARDVVTAAPVPVIIAHRPAAVAPAGAAGVHLGWTSPSVSEARAQIPGDARIGVSVHSVEEGLARAAEGADYLFFGPVRATPKPHGPVTPLGYDPVASLAAAVSIPVVAIGGLGPADDDAVRGTGAAGWAAIRAFGATGERAS